MSKSFTHFCYEYAYAYGVGIYNVSHKNGKTMSYEDAKAIHDDVINQVGADNDSFAVEDENNLSTRYMNAVNNAALSRGFDEVYPAEGGRGKEIFEQSVNRFNSCFSKDLDPTLPGSLKSRSERFMPISPYDKGFRERDTFKNTRGKYAIYTVTLNDIKNANMFLHAYSQKPLNIEKAFDAMFLRDNKLSYEKIMSSPNSEAVLNAINSVQVRNFPAKGESIPLGPAFADISQKEAKTPRASKGFDDTFNPSVEGVDFTHFCYEYTYAFGVGFYNKSHSDKPMNYEDAKLIHDDILHRLGENNDSFTVKDDVSFKMNFINTANECAKDRGFEPLFPGSIQNNKVFDTGYNRFYSCIEDNIDHSKPGALKNRMQKILPLSPYDKGFREREVFKNTRGKYPIYALPLSSVRSANEMILNYQDNNIDVKNIYDPMVLRDNYPSFAKIRQDEDSKELNKALRNITFTEFTPDKRALSIGPVIAEKDATGVTALSNYMTYKELNSFVNYTKSAKRPLNQVDFANMVDMVKKLQDEGEGFTFDFGRNGIVSANLNAVATPLSVTLLNTKDRTNYNYVKASSRNYTFNTSKIVHANDNKFYKPYIPTAEEVYDVVKFAKGENVHTNVLDINNEAMDLGEVRDLKGKQSSVKYQHYDKYQRARQKDHVNFAYKSMNDASGNYTLSVSCYVFDNKKKDKIRYTDINKEFAEDELRKKILESKENFINSIDIDEIVDFAKTADEDDQFTRLSDDKDISKLQRLYYNHLTKDAPLIKPSYEYDDYLDMLESGEYKNLTDEEKATLNEGIDMITYKSEDKLENIKHHLIDYVNHNVGSFDKDERGRRFDPRYLYKYSNEMSEVNKGDFICEYCKALDLQVDEFKTGSSMNNVFYDKLIKFDEESAVDLKSMDNEFTQNIYDDMSDVFKHRGYSVDSILMDKNGIIKYEATNQINPRTTDYMKVGEKLTGTIGQVFIPEKEGYVKTKFNSDRNVSFIPAYSADIVANKPGENKTVEQRTKLTGYEEMMRNTIKTTLANNITLTFDKDLEDNISLNKVYSQILNTSYDKDYFNDLETNELKRYILETEKRRVKYSNAIKEGSTLHATFEEQDVTEGVTTLTDGRNMAIMTPEGDPYFDPIVTSGSTNQGTVRYLLEGTKVDKDGFMIPSDIENDKSPIRKYGPCKYIDFDPYDRQQMSISNVLHANQVTEPTKVANLSFGGWTQDDSIVISKRFAETYQVPTENGAFRPLKIGDKISDFHGNKGCISLVVDPEMSREDAIAKDILKPVQWFKANPSLDVVMAPYTAPSRFNGGTAIEMMSSDVEDLYSPDGSVYPAAIGEVGFIVTKHTVNEKTKSYDDRAFANGKGRKASSQLAWSLQGRGCENILKEIYGNNSNSLIMARERLITLGLDIDEDGRLQNGYHPHNGEERNVININDYIDLDDKVNTSYTDLKNDKSKYIKDITNYAGFMKIPFELEYPNGEKLTKTDDNMYLLPIAPVGLRYGVEKFDGLVSSDYNRFYEKVYDTVVESYSLQNYLENETMKDERRAGHLESLSNMEASLQRQFSLMNNKVRDTYIDTKNNIIKESIMNKRLANSATAVWTGDPRCDLDSIVVSPELAKTLKVKEGDHVLLFRDPQLRKEGAWGFKVGRIDEDYTGIGINPSMCSVMEGDFDGDSVGLWKPETKAAQRELREKMSARHTLIDEGKVKDGLSPLAANIALDLKSYAYENPDWKEHINELTVLANKNSEMKELLENKEGLSEIQHELKLSERQADLEELYGPERRSVEEYKKLCMDKDVEIYKDINRTVKQGHRGSYALACLRYDGFERHIEGVVHDCVTTEAKGNLGKIKVYMKYLGTSFEEKENGDIIYDSIKYEGHTLATREDHLATQYATCVKSFGTGRAGALSQRGVLTLRNKAMNEICEITAGSTHSLLQSKHDPIEAERKYDVIINENADILKGKAFVKQSYTHTVDVDGQMVEEVRNKWVETPASQKGELTADEWRNCAYAFFKDPDGLNLPVNKKHVDAIGRAIADENGYVCGINEKIGPDNEFVSTMDCLTYYNNVNTYNQMMSYEGRSLFEGKNNHLFAPKVILKNEGLSKDEKVGFYNKECCSMALKAQKEAAKLEDKNQEMVLDEKIVEETDKTVDEIVVEQVEINEPDLDFVVIDPDTEKVVDNESSFSTLMDIDMSKDVTVPITEQEELFKTRQRIVERDIDYIAEEEDDKVINISDIGLEDSYSPYPEEKDDDFDFGL